MLSDPDAIEPPSLLPPSATPLETALASATALRLAALPATLQRLIDLADSAEPADDLAPFLPWLAWGAAVDIWNPKWSDDMQHEAVRQAPERHRRAGTPDGVKEAIRQVLAEAVYPRRRHLRDLHEMDNLFSLKECWDLPSEHPYAADNHYFEVALWAGRGHLRGPALDGRLYQKLRRAIDDVRPMNTRYRLIAGGIDLQANVSLTPVVRVTQFARYTAAIDPSGE